MVPPALVLLVYFAQTTAVRLDSLDEQAMRMLDYGKGGLFFYYDLLGYGMMALSTFFMGLTVGVRDGADRWLKGLMLGHGVFFFSCLLMPMTGMLSGEGNGGGGTIALEVWCAELHHPGQVQSVHPVRLFPVQEGQLHTGTREATRPSRG